MANVFNYNGAIIQYISGTTYKYVRKYEIDGVITYRATIPKYRWTFYTTDIRQAAVAVDKKLLQKGCKPVNILTKSL